MDLTVLSYDVHEEGCEVFVVSIYQSICIVAPKHATCLLKSGRHRRSFILHEQSAVHGNRVYKGQFSVMIIVNGNGNCFATNLLLEDLKNFSTLYDIFSCSISTTWGNLDLAPQIPKSANISKENMHKISLVYL